MLSLVSQLELTTKTWMPRHTGHQAFRLPIFLYFLQLCSFVTSWPHASRVQEDTCPGPEWNVMCRSCCEYEHILCKCPAQGTQVGYAVPCCRNALDQCDPCIFHQGCSVFENCKSCHNGTWEARDDFYIRGKYCTECRQGWSGGDCRTCGGVINRRQGHVTLESYPINARCDWTVHVNRGMTLELSFTMLNLEFDHSCRYDYVEVRNGDRLNSPMIGRYCGDERPRPIRSSGDSLHIHFVSDGYHNFDGFFATFQEISACASYPCLNDGSCFLDPILAFRCACLSGYTGPRCENGAVKPACGVPEKPAHGDLYLQYVPGDVLNSAEYLCHKPYRLSGAKHRTCLSNNTWSGTAPTCVKEPAKNSCPLPLRLHHGYYRLALGSGEKPNMVQLFCNNSYVLSGDSQRTCLSNGSWSGRQPRCVRACREPKVSKLVRQRVIEPQALSRRKSPGNRLYSSSKQKMADLVTPSKEPSVLVELPRGFHHLYTHIEYECASPLYQHFGSARRTCLKTGKWSGRHISCSPVCGKLTSVSPQTPPADTRWPWHAAIYRRFPNRDAHRAGSTAGRGDAFGRGEREKEEEGWPWQLVCSGALVNQHSVVVAAHCVAEPGKLHAIGPADVKVVMGKHYLSDFKETRKLQHLRVAAILIHMNYDPLLFDSDLAMLTLLDKARISEHVLPVCLPRMQGGEVTAQQGYAIAWSIMEKPESVPNTDDEVAQTGLIELGDVAQCERQYSQNGAPISVTDNMLCGRQHPLSPFTVCPARTGGIALVPSSALTPPSSPLTSNPKRDDTDNVWELLGLVSFGYDQQNCNPGLYTVYTRAASFKNWIENNMK